MHGIQFVHFVFREPDGAELRDAKNTRNPGTTADLTCAALFVVILEGSWNR